MINSDYSFSKGLGMLRYEPLMISFATAILKQRKCLRASLKEASILPQIVYVSKPLSCLKNLKQALIYLHMTIYDFDNLNHPQVQTLSIICSHCHEPKTLNGPCLILVCIQ
jgi:hypothetical protein